MILIKTLKLLKSKRTSKLNFLINQRDNLLFKSKTNNKTTLFKINNSNWTIKQLKTKKNLKQNLISFLIKFNLTLTNTFINVTDIKGNLILSLSAGRVELQKRQKTSQPNALIQILKHLFLKAKFLQNKTVGLQFKNLKSYHELIIINILKNKIFIKSLRSYNLYPHNGCRPKKIKRFKYRTKRLSR